MEFRDLDDQNNRERERETFRRGAGKETETSLLFLRQKQEKKRPAEKAVQGNSSLMQSGKQRIALQQSHHLSSV